MALVPFPGTKHAARAPIDPDEEETDLLTLDATSLIYALLNAVRELSAKVAALEAAK